MLCDDGADRLTSQRFWSEGVSVETYSGPCARLNSRSTAATSRVSVGVILRRRQKAFKKDLKYNFINIGYIRFSQRTIPLLGSGKE